jgi:hypothetical protein
MKTSKKNTYKIIILQNGNIKKICHIGRSKAASKEKYKEMLDEQKNIVIRKTTVRDGGKVIPAKYEIMLISDDKIDKSKLYEQTLTIEGKTFYILKRSNYNIEEKIFVIPHKKHFFFKDILDMIKEHTLLSVYLVGNKILIFDQSEMRIIFSMSSKSKIEKLYKVIRKYYLGKFFFYENMGVRKLPHHVKEGLNEYDISIKNFNKYRKEIF